MTIRIIRTASLGLPVGTFRTLAPATEAALVADKEAVYDGPQAGLAGPVTADASGNLFANGRQIQGSVSGAGIAYADVATTSGSSLGERRTLIDGPDAGLVLVWFQPADASAPTWCFGFYPQSSYL